MLNFPTESNLADREENYLLLLSVSDRIYDSLANQKERSTLKGLSVSGAVSHWSVRGFSPRSGLEQTDDDRSRTHYLEISIQTQREMRKISISREHIDDEAGDTEKKMYSLCPSR